MTGRLTPDPRSHDFLWRDRPETDLRCLTPFQIEQYNREGYLLYRNAVGTAGIAALLGEIDPIESGIRDTLLTLEGDRRFSYAADNMTFARNLHARCKSLREIVSGPFFRALVHDLIGPDVRLYWDQAVYKKPEKGRIFPWHQDNGYTFAEPQAYLTCWLALNDATEANGCPEILPGLHRMGTLIHDSMPDGIEIRGARHPDIEGTAVTVPARAGDLVIFSSLTPHRTGANRTDGVRKALIVQFMPDGMMLVGEDGVRKTLNSPENNPYILHHGVAP